MLEIDFRRHPDEYLFAARKYIYEGMETADWRPERNKVRGWYHVPWLHVGPHPREFLRGMTRERDSEPGELGPLQRSSTQNWAVGFYNDRGGYTIGRVWADPDRPVPAQSTFPVGTVVAKVLFTEATAEQVPELDGAVEWEAYIHSEASVSSPKQIRKLRLLQLDIAVKDARAGDATGWVFGTFVYDKTAHGANGWEKMMPVGLMWGNDPGIRPADIAAGGKLSESRISTRIPPLAKSRLGWAGRLNGPVDNSSSACLSCHSTSQTQRKSPLAPSGTDEQRLRWFRNLKSNEPFDAGEISLDYSLQMTKALENYLNAKR